MKYVSFILTGVAVLSAVTSGWCQGVVNFNNIVLPGPPNGPDRLVRYWDGSPLVGTQYAAQLYYGGTPNEGSLVAHTAAPQRFRPGTTMSPGTWTTTGGTRTLTSGGVGVPVWMQVRIWNLDMFQTFEAAVAGGGETARSAIFEYVQRSSPQPDPTDTYMANFVGFTVPEPSAFLLAVPGLAGLLWWDRRRKLRADKASRSVD